MRVFTLDSAKEADRTAMLMVRAERALSDSLELAMFGDSVEQRVADLRASILGGPPVISMKLAGLAAFIPGVPDAH